MNRVGRSLIVVSSVALVLGALSCGQSAPLPAVPTLAPTPTSVLALATLLTGPSATQMAVAAATSIASSPVQIINGEVDEVNPGASSITLRNSGTQPVNLSGWTLLFGTYRATFPTTNYMTIEPSAIKNIYLSSSSNPAQGDNLYLGISAIDSGTGALTEGGRIVLINSDGHVASAFERN